MGSGGGYTVGVELWRHLALVRPDWTITLAAVVGNTLHEEARNIAAAENCKLLWAPPEAARRGPRARYEKTALVEWVRQNQVSAALQLNGMVVPGMPVPTLAHCQDPWPYRPVAWENGHKDRALAFLKRRANATAFRQAACVGWTSAYLRYLMCEALDIRPRHGHVFYNGVPDAWIARAQKNLPDWETRPLQIVTISNVAPYKQQEMVIRALPLVREQAGLKTLVYRIAGACAPAYAEHLRRVAQSIGVADAVVIEGRVSAARIAELFSQSRCYVLMSKCESFGLPAIEAMTFGTPVITADCCAMPEVCGDAAELCPLEDTTALAAKIVAVLTDPERAPRLRLAGARQVQKFQWRETAEKMAAALGGAIEADAAHARRRAASGAADGLV